MIGFGYVNHSPGPMAPEDKRFSYKLKQKMKMIIRI